MTRLNVLVAIHHRVAAWTIPPGHVQRLREGFPHITFLHARDRHENLSLAPDADIAFALLLGPDVVAAAPRLRWVHGSAHAVGQFPLRELAARRILVTNSRGIQSAPIAEHVMAGILALARRLPDVLARQAQRAWTPNDFVGAASPWSIAGKTVGIIGLGTLGQAIAVRARSFGMRVLGMRRREALGAPPEVDRIVTRENLPAFLAESDVVVLAAPSTPGTTRILDAPAIATLKPGAIVVNVSRGELVDEQALAEALESGRLGGAILDVFEREPLPLASPLWSRPNVIVTPHMAGFRSDHFDAVVALFSENLRRFERGTDLLNTVDLEAGY